MSSTILRISLVSSMALGVATANAQGKPAADAGASAAPAAHEAPTPAPELALFMKDMLGAWTCATTFPAGAVGPGSPEMKTTAKIKFSKEASLGGFFYRGEFSIAKSKDMPGMNGIFHMGYESASKQVISLGVDNMGAAWMGAGPLSETSATWTGDSYMMGKKLKFRETMTKTAPKQVTHTFEVDMGKGFQKMGEDVCKK